MKRRLSWAFVLLFIGIAWSGWAEEQGQAPPAGPQVAPGTPRNVILISWDGCDRPVVKELMDGGKLPNLSAIAKEGSRQPIEVKGHVTVTKPGHAEMLTGLAAEVTGVYSNTKYQPIPEGCTVFEKLQAFLGKDNIATIMVTGKLAHVGARGPDEIKGAVKAAKKGKKGKAPEGADDTPDTETKGEPFYLTKKHLDVCDIAQRDAVEVGPLCLKYLEQYKGKRFFAFLHFSDPDHKGHKYGSGSQEYRQGAMDCDVWLGKIVDFLKKENLYENTLIYVMTDHGFDVNATSHNKAPHSWLVTNDKLVTHGGTIADVPATIMARFGIEVGKLEPKLIGKPLTGAAPVTEEKAPAKEPVTAGVVQ
jgi:predicted AlkP superfamily pyrophosphatase or phosphodiesterase